MPWADASYTDWIDEYYLLFHGTERVGVVECDGGDAGFPQFWSGHLSMDAAAPERVKEFFRRGRIDLEQLDSGGEYKAERAAYVADFADLMRSPAWRLVDDRGVDVPLAGVQPQRGSLITWVRADGLDWGQIAEPGNAANPDGS